jgi:hypothetical protein
VQYALSPYIKQIRFVFKGLIPSLISWFDKYILLFSDSECPVEEPGDSIEIETTENGQYRTFLRVPRLAVTCLTLICSLQRSIRDCKYSTYSFLTDSILHMSLVPRPVCVVKSKIQQRPRFMFQDKDKMDVLVFNNVYYQ